MKPTFVAFASALTFILTSPTWASEEAPHAEGGPQITRPNPIRRSHPLVGAYTYDARYPTPQVEHSPSPQPIQPEAHPSYASTGSTPALHKMSLGEALKALREEEKKKKEVAHGNIKEN